MPNLETETQPAGRLEALQVLRAVAALLVVFSHVMRVEHEPWGSSVASYTPALVFGDLGVYAFFVVSGFIMYLTAGHQFGLQGAAVRFLLRRLSRIAPIYWLFTGLALLCPFAFGWRPASAGTVALSVGFLPDLARVPTHVLAVGWTLSFEMLFYLLFSACLTLPRRIGLPVLLLAFPLLFDAVVLLARGDIAAQPWWRTLLWWVRPPILLFVYGVLLAMAKARFRRPVDDHGRGIWAGLGVLVLAPVVMAAWRLGRQEALEMELAAIAVTLWVASSGGRWGRLTPLVRLGDASYALYLSHPFVVGALATTFWGMGRKAPVAFHILALVASCATAWLVHIILEKPLTRSTQRLLERLRPPTAASAGAVA